MLRAAVCPCRSATTQCSTRMASPVRRSGQRAMSPAAKIPGALVSRNASTSKPAVDLEASRFCKAEARTHAEPGDDEIGLERASAFQRHAFAFHAARRLAQMEDDAMVLVDRLNEAAEVRPQDLFHRPFFRRDDMDLDVARAQRGRDFEPDEARAEHNDPLCRLGAFDDRLAVLERAEHEHVRRLGAGEGRGHGLGAGREKQAIVRNSCRRWRASLHARGRRWRRRSYSGAGRWNCRNRTWRRAAAATLPARCRRDNPWTDWADRPAARRRCSA